MSEKTDQRIFVRVGQLLRSTGRDFLHNDCAHWAAALAFYGTLSLFPLILFAVSIASFFVDPNWAASKATDLLGSVALPDGDALRNVIQNAFSQRHHSGLFSVVVLLWAGTRIFSVLRRALNVAFDVDETDSWPRQFLVQVVMLLSASIFFSVALLTDFGSALLAHSLDALPGIKPATFALVSWIAPPVLLFAGSFCLFRFVPREHCSGRSALTGAAVTALALLLARWIFLEYLHRLASYNQIYGWLAVGAVLLVWAYIVACITLFGGELTSHVQLMLTGQFGKDRTKWQRKRSPRRR